MNDIFKNELNKIADEICGDKTSKIILGKCSDGFELPGFKIKNNAKNEYILIIGMPHGNEPVGFWYCLDFMRNHIKNEPFNYNNYLIIPVLDYEVAIRNMWISEKFNLTRFSHSNFLNTVNEQIEFTYGKNHMVAHHKGLINLVNETIIKYAIFIHQTPTLYGGYYYTNIEDKSIHKKLKIAMAKQRIPPEVRPQGTGVEIKDIGIFGVFGIDNISIKKYDSTSIYSCQEYFDKILNIKFLTIEIPFYIAINIYIDKSIKLQSHRAMIMSILKESNILIYKIKNSLDKKNAKEAYYWLSSFLNMDKIINNVINKFEDSINLVDMYYILRNLFYKMSYLAIASQIPCIEISKKASYLIVQILDLFYYYSDILDIREINNIQASALINECIQVVIGDETK